MASIGQYKGKEIASGSEESIKNQIAAIDASQPVSSTTLQPAKPLTLPTTNTPTSAANLQGQLETFSAAGQQAAAERAKQGMQTSGKAYADALFGAEGQTALTDSLYSQDGGVDDTQRELNDINQQILQEQEGLRREIETIEDNADAAFGVTKGAVAQRIDEARRKSLRTQADLSVVQMAKQGRYDSAKQIADRAVAALMEKQKMRLDNLRFVYEENKDLFNKADQRAFEVAQKERERQYEAEEYRLRARFDAQIKQSDPLYQIQIANAKANLQQTRLQTLKLQGEMESIAVPASSLSLSKQETNIDEVGTLLTSSALNGAVGPNKLARFTPIQSFSGERSNFIASIEQLRSNLNLDTLIQAKGSGATFGALSDQELRILGNAATKLGSWAIEKDGRVVGYDVDQKSFRDELQKINNFTKLDYILKGGDPTTIGVNVTPDGRMWVRNYDNSLTELQ